MRDRFSRSRPVACLVEAGHGAGQRSQPGLRVGQEPLAEFGHADTARGAVEQAHAEPALQRAQGLRQRRRRHAEFDGRTGEAGVVRDAGECGDGGKQFY